MQGKNIIITGASDGLGRATALKLAAMGARIALVSNDEEKLNLVAEQIGNSARVYVCDISLPDKVRATAGQIAEDFNIIDVLINCAGIWTDEELEKADPYRRKKVLEVNALGTIEFTKAFEPIFRSQNEGQVLNVISTAGTNDTSSGDNTLWQTYGASKWALAGFTRAFKDSLEETNIKVTGFYPGGFESNIYESAGIEEDAHEQPWMMNVEDVADALIFCLTRPSDMVVEKLVVSKLSRAAMD